MKIKYRLLIALLVIGIYLIYNAYPCIMVSMSGFPKSITKKVTNQKKIVLLYGAGICGTCPAGEFVSALSEKKNVLFVVPEELSDFEVDNLRGAFDIVGEIAKGNEEIITFLKRVSKCSRLNTWKKNFYAELDEGKKLKLIRPF